MPHLSVAVALIPGLLQKSSWWLCALCVGTSSWWSVLSVSTNKTVPRLTILNDDDDDDDDDDDGWSHQSPAQNLQIYSPSEDRIVFLQLLVQTHLRGLLFYVRIFKFCVFISDSSFKKYKFSLNYLDHFFNLASYWNLQGGPHPDVLMYLF